MKLTLRPLAAAVRATGLRAVQVAGVAAATFTAPQAIAGPEGGEVARGSANIASAAGVTTIDQYSDRAVLLWNKFNVASGEQVRFNQPGVDSATLNRVTSAGASIIEGLLSANGNVFIVNPSGILFSQSARIDVGGLVATTADIGDDAFMGGDFRFDIPSPDGSSVVNRGAITARDSGLVALVAPGAANSGVIQARLGSVTLASGKTFSLDLYGDGLVRLPVAHELFGTIVTADGTPLSALVDQSGELHADGGKVYLLASTASAALDAAIDARGIVRSRAAGAAAGEIVIAAGQGLVKIGADVDASGLAQGEAGGRVTVTGDDVVLASGARVDARGDAGGGTVLIGGDYQGRGETARAKNTRIEQGATIDASAAANGDGGKVIVWADGDTTFDGTIHADAGAAGGDGGFIEVSGKEFLRFAGEAFAGAPAGVAGAILLDPEDILVTPFGRDDVDGAVVRGEAISQMLRQGMQVVLTADDTITLRDVIDARALEAGDGSAPGAALVLRAGNGIAIGDGFGAVTNGGQIDLDAGAGSITMGVDAYLIVGNGGLAGTPVSAATARQSLPHADSVRLDGDGAMSFARIVSLGRVNVTSRSTVNFNNALFGLVANQDGVGDLSVQGTNVTLRGGSVTNNVDVHATGAISLEAAATGQNTTLIAGGSVTLDAAGAINVGRQANTADASVVAGAGAAAAALDVLTSGAVTLDGAVVNQRGAVTIGTATRLASSIEAAGIQAIAAGADPTGGSNITLRASGDIDVNALITGRAGAVSIATPGAVTIGSAVAGLAASSGIEGMGVASFNVDAGGTVALAGFRTAGNAAIRSGGNVQNSATVAGGNAMVAGGGLSVDAAGSFTLGVGTGINSTGSVSILANQAATLAANVKAGTTLTLGSAQRKVGSVSGPASALLAAGDVSVVSSGDVAAARIEGANVLVDAKKITLGRSSDGFGIVATGTAVTLAATDDVESAGGISANNANVTVGTSATRIGGDIAFCPAEDCASEGSPIVTANGAINLHALGSVAAHNVSTRGTVNVSSASGDVILRRPIGGITETNGSLSSPVSVSIAAPTGNVTMHGATTDLGDIIIVAGGAFSNATVAGASSAIAAAGDLSITAGLGGVSVGAGAGLQAGSDGAAVQDGAGNDLTIRTNGAVRLDGGALAFNGGIEIGAVSARVSQVQMGDGTALQALGRSIAIWSAGDVIARDLVSNGNVRIDVASSATTPVVRLLRPLFGQGSTGTGIGSLGVTTPSGSVEVWGVTATGAGAIGGNAIDLDARFVSVMGPLDVATGAIRLGNGVVGAEISLNHNIRTGGGEVRFRGDTTLFAGRINSTKNGFAGIYYYLPTNADPLALPLFGPGGVLALDVAKDTNQHRLITDGVTDPVVLAALSADLEEDGSSLYKVATVFDGSNSCMNSARVLYCSPSLMVGAAAAIDIDDMFQPELVADLDDNDILDATLPDLQYDSASLAVAFRTVLNTVVDADGRTIVNGIGFPRAGRSLRIDDICQQNNECARFAVGADLSSLLDPPSSAEIVAAITRQVALERAFGTTVVSMSTGGGNVTFDGALDRFDTLDLAQSIARDVDSDRYEYSSGQFRIDGNVVGTFGSTPFLISPTSTNHLISIDTGAGTVQFGGIIGDERGVGRDLVSGYAAKPASWCEIGHSLCAPPLGAFNVQVTAGNVVFDGDHDAFVNTWSVSVQPTELFVATEWRFNLLSFGGTTFDAERQIAAGTGRLGGTGFAASRGFSGFGISPVNPGPTSFSSTSRALVPSTGRGGAADSISGGASVSAVSNTEETARPRSNTDLQDGSQVTDENVGSRACPDGAAADADVGQTQADTGIASDVFTRCDADFGT